MKNALILLTFILVLSGCSLFKKQEIQTPKPSLDILIPEPLKLDNVTFVVLVTPEKTPLYCLQDKDYIALSNDMEKIQNHLDIQHQSMLYTKDYYEKSKK